MKTDKKIVFCGVCGKNLGEYKPRFAKDHLKKYPSHNSFIVKRLLDPLLLPNPDEWFKKHIPLMRKAHQPKGNTDNITDKETVPKNC